MCEIRNRFMLMSIKLFLALFLLFIPHFVYSGSIGILVGGGMFIQEEDFLNYEEVGNSNRALTIQLTNRIIKHISLGADITLIDSRTKYNVNGAYLVSDYSYVDYLGTYILANFDFFNNVFFIQIGIGLVVELEYKERVFFGAMGGLGVNIPITENISIPIMARVDVHLAGSDIRYPVSFALGFAYEIN